MEIYQLWKEWLHRTKPEDRTQKVRDDFGDTSLPFDEWWPSHKHLFIKSGDGKPEYTPAKKVWKTLIKCLQKTLLVYDHNERYKRMKLAKYNLYDVAIDADLAPDLVPLETDGSILVGKKRQALTARAAKCVTEAEALKVNVAMGIFPCFELPEGYKPPEARKARIHVRPGWL